MKTKSFIEQLRAESDPLIGTLVSMASLDAVDVLCSCGFDWLFLDLEHSGLSASEAKALLQVVGDRAFVLARVAENSAVAIKQALDIGCDGVIVPLVNSRSEAADAVRAAKYPPVGERSAGIGRAQGYGSAMKSYIDGANGEIAVVVQVEHRLAVEALDEILTVEGIDAVFIGPYDLSGSMNLLGQVSHPQVRGAIQEVRVKCKRAGMPYGFFGMTAESCAEELRQGANMVVVGLDTMHLYNGATAQLKLLRPNG